MLKVVERKTNRTGLATELPEGRYKVDFGNDDVRELASSTFKRLFTVTGEMGEEDVQAVTQDEETIEESNNVEQSDEEEVDNSSEESEVAASKEEEPNPEATELDELLEGAESVEEDTTEEPAQEDGKEDTSSTKEPERSVEDLGLDIKLLHWNMSSTRGGKTDKVTSTVAIKGHTMDITEYAGYITDVRVFKENPEAPENDPDSALELVYKSPKMSLKDTLEWFGLNESDMKLARREITAIRKAVKEEYLASKDTEEEAAQ